MGFLGLDQTEVKDDNFFQRMFWPGDHAGEADTLGQQGFWICFIIAVASLGMLTIQGHWLLGLFTFSFYGLGGVGVREHSQPAAILVASAYILEMLVQLFGMGIPPGGFGIIVSLLLLANIRGTWMAAKWADAAGAEAMPDRMNTTYTDKLVDQMPAKVWPKAKIPFFVLAALYLMMAMLTTVFFAALVPARLKASEPQLVKPDATLEITPTR